MIMNIHNHEQSKRRRPFLDIKLGRQARLIDKWLFSLERAWQPIFVILFLFNDVWKRMTTEK